jgi:hypothetical protein
VALATTVGLQVVVVRRSSAYRALPQVLGAVALLAALGVAATWVVRRTQAPGAWRAAVPLLAVVLAAGPASWSSAAIRHPVGGVFPVARPGDTFSYGPPTPGGPYGTANVTDDSLRWLDGQRSQEEWAVAMPSAMVAADAIIAGHRVLAIGGFDGRDGSASVERLADAVAERRIRFVLAIAGPAGLREPEVFTTVRAVCTRVPSSAWGGTGPSQLYDCAGAASEIAAGP